MASSSHNPVRVRSSREWMLLQAFKDELINYHGTESRAQNAPYMGHILQYLEDRVKEIETQTK